MFKDLFKGFLDLLEELFSREEIWWLLIVVLIGSVFIIGIQIDINFYALLFLILSTLKKIWWLLLFFILFFSTKSLWLFWRSEIFKQKIKWVNLLIKIPRYTLKSPKAMEQILTSINSLGNFPTKFKDKFIKGQITRWYSLEIISIEGNVQMLVRTDAAQAEIIKASFFAYYPEVEVSEVDDYLLDTPTDLQDLYFQGYDFWGAEIGLKNIGLYPIKTYSEFLENKDEEKVLDPISNFFEVLGKLKTNELGCIHILIKPQKNDWVKKYDAEFKALKEPKTVAKGTTSQVIVSRTPGETDKIKAVENNLSKPAFSAIIRVFYKAPLANFSSAFFSSGILGAFNQYSTINLNSFTVSSSLTVNKYQHFFKKTRELVKKQRFLLKFIKRDIPPITRMGRFIISNIFNWSFGADFFDINTECLATIFHIPTKTVVSSIYMDVMTSKKVNPPVNESIFGQEKDIEKFIS
ncbi:MAG: hypothetical protein ACP5IC_02200 [Minisyncoccia bacterium]